MKEKIEQLKHIILTNTELHKYSDEIQNNWSYSQLKDFIEKILIDFLDYQNNPERPAFYTKLQVLLNKYSENNSYRKPISE